MPLSRLTALFLRLYVLYQGLDFFISLSFGLWFRVMNPSTIGHNFFSGSLFAIAVDGIALVVLVILWSMANPLSRWMVGSPDPEVSLGTIALSDLLHIAIIVLGILFLVHGLSSVATEMERLAYFRRSDFTNDNPALYANLVGAITRFALGLFLVLGHRKVLRWFVADKNA